MCFYIVPSFITCSITSEVRKKLQANIVSETFNSSLFTILSSFPLIRQHVHPSVAITFDPNVTIDEEILERGESQPIKVNFEFGKIKTSRTFFMILFSILNLAY